MIRCISIYTNTDEHYNNDFNKVYFCFFDEDKQVWFRGAITYEKLFELLKPLLKIKSD
jgi:hypothetical protein